MGQVAELTKQLRFLSYGTLGDPWRSEPVNRSVKMEEADASWNTSMAARLKESIPSLRLATTSQTLPNGPVHAGASTRGLHAQRLRLLLRPRTLRPLRPLRRLNLPLRTPLRHTPRLPLLYLLSLPRRPLPHRTHLLRPTLLPARFPRIPHLPARRFHHRALVR